MSTEDILLPLTRKFKVKLIPKIVVRFRFRIDINWADDLLHSCSHRGFNPNFTFAFAFVILKVINSEIILFRFALVSVSMVIPSKRQIDTLQKGIGDLQSARITQKSPHPPSLFGGSHFARNCFGGAL